MSFNFVAANIFLKLILLFRLEKSIFATTKIRQEKVYGQKKKFFMAFIGHF